MRNVYLICYDVSDPKRLRQVYRILKGAGDAMQFSVFRCELTSLERQQLIAQLWEILDLNHDRLLLANLGPASTRGEDCLVWWGNPREAPENTTSFVV